LGFFEPPSRLWVERESDDERNPRDFVSSLVPVLQPVELIKDVQAALQVGCGFTTPSLSVRFSAPDTLV